MNKCITLLVGAAALVASTAAFAGAPDASDSTPAATSNGFYVNGNVGYGHSAVDTSGMTFPGVSFDKNGFVWSALAGYQFNQYIAVEAGYMSLPKVEVTVSGMSATLNTNAAIADAKAMYPINEQFDVFAKAGLAYLWQSVSADGVTTSGDENVVTPLFGLGVDYNLNENLAITVQGITTLERNDGDFPATYSGLIGLTYKFA